jgi:hypothetical protein
MDLAPFTAAITALLLLGVAATEMRVVPASTVAVYSWVPAENEGLRLPGEILSRARELSEDLDEDELDEAVLLVWLVDA